MNSHVFKAIILPGLIFQSVIIAGGYATGRELVEFFLSIGPIEGLLGISVVAVIWAIVLSLSFELARVTKSYDYKSFFKVLLGRGWVLFEIAYLLVLLLVLSIIGTAAGVMFNQITGLPSLWGAFLLIIVIGFLTFKGSKVIENVLASWSFVLYAVYIVFVILGMIKFGDKIVEGFALPRQDSPWFLNGVKYASYNLAVVPTILFCITHLKSRKQAFTAGIVGSILAVVPAVLFYIVLVGFYPDILTSTVPVNDILAAIDFPIFLLVFNVVVFGTFIETGAALLHAVNERIVMTYSQNSKELPPYIRPAIAITLLFVSIFIGREIGLITLISKGYGLITYVFLAIFILPLLTVGLYKIFGAKNIIPQ